MTVTAIKTTLVLSRYGKRDERHEAMRAARRLSRRWLMPAQRRCVICGAPACASGERCRACSGVRCARRPHGAAQRAAIRHAGAFCCSMLRVKCVINALRGDAYAATRYNGSSPVPARASVCRRALTPAAQAAYGRTHHATRVYARKRCSAPPRCLPRCPAQCCRRPPRRAPRHAMPRVPARRACSPRLLDARAASACLLASRTRMLLRASRPCAARQRVRVRRYMRAHDVTYASVMRKP